MKKLKNPTVNDLINVINSVCDTTFIPYLSDIKIWGGEYISLKVCGIEVAAMTFRNIEPKTVICQYSSSEKLTDWQKKNIQRICDAWANQIEY